MPRFSTSLIAALVIFGLAGCSDDSPSEVNCSSDQLYDQVNEQCVPRSGLHQPDADSDGSDVVEDVGTDSSSPDVEEDAGSDADDAADTGDVIDMEQCDKDHDEAIDEACGGYDCDDNDPARSPYHTEICDEIDNNCSGRVNDNVTCTFYAHSRNDLYEIDPFAKTATQVGTNLPDLQDIDTHPDGTLFGVNHDGIYLFVPWADSWLLQGDFGSTNVGDPNGLAIDSSGVAFITSQDKMYTADLSTGRATWLGETGDFYSSGDCVVDKYDTLFMTSKEEGQPDKLVQVARDTGLGTAVGETGFQKIFALTAAWGKLYGLTSAGELIELNQQDGSGTLVHTFDGISFWGAASTPNR